MSSPASSARLSAGRRLLNHYFVRHPYVLALGALAAGILVRWLLTPVVGWRLPYITLFPAIFAVAWYGGLGPTLLAAAVGAVAAQLLFFPQRFTFQFGDPVEVAGTILFLAIGLMAGAMGEARRRAVKLAAEAAIRADEERERAEDAAARAEEAAAEAEEAAQEAAEALTARLEAEATARRTEDAVRALQRLESVGRLAGGVAHEVNNQMSVVLGAAGFILRRDDVPEAIRTDVELMRDAAERSAGITGQLLAFGRRQLLRPEVLDLHRVIQDFEPVLRRTSGSLCELRLDVGDPGGTARADRNQLEQVLLNLAINAVDAMPRGGVLDIRLGATDLVELDPRLPLEPDVRPGRYAELAVRDTGTGMDARTLAHVFEPFFTTKPVGEGTGLGLSTAYGIVRQSGGYLGVWSAPEQGTVFTVYLPLSAEPVSRPVHDAIPAPIGGRETVLLVEDQAEVRQMAARSLRAEGYTVLEAGDGQEALDLVEARTTEIGLVLTDLAMPRLGGLDLSGELARLAPRVPVLFMTGYTSSEAMRRGALRRGYPLIEKPFTPEALAASVRAALDTAGSGVPTPG